MVLTLCSTRTVACLWKFVGMWARVCVCVRICCWQLGFATWQDEDWIGRVPWHACMHEWNPHSCSHDWCKSLCLRVFYIPSHVHASILGLQGKPALSCIWHSYQNNNTCLSHYRRLWAKKRWLRWKQIVWSMGLGLGPCVPMLNPGYLERFFLGPMKRAENLEMSRKKASTFFCSIWGFRYIKRKNISGDFSGHDMNNIIQR